MFLSKKTQLVAIDIGSSSIKLVQLSEIKEGEFELTHFGMMPLDDECIVEGVIKQPERVAEALKNLIKAEKIQSHYAVSAVAGEAVPVKGLVLRRAAKTAVAAQGEDESPLCIWAGIKYLLGFLTTHEIHPLRVRPNTAL